MERDKVVELVEEHTRECRIEMYQKIDKINSELEKQKAIRKEMSEKLEEIYAQSKRNHEAFSRHDIEEMKKYSETIDTIKKLTETLQNLIEETSKNSEFVDSKKQDEEIERRVKKELEERNKPREELWHKVKMTAVVIITGATLSGIGSVIYAGFKLYIAIGLDNQ